MNILEALPSIGKILDDVISTPEEKREAQIRLRELDIREIEAKSQVQSSWMSNQSLFVAGAIPSMLWMVVLVVFFNYIISPLTKAAFGVTIPILDLPEWYSNMCSTIILGLFAKKAWDNTDMSFGNMVKHSSWETEEKRRRNRASSRLPLSPSDKEEFYEEDDREYDNVAEETQSHKEKKVVKKRPVKKQQYQSDTLPYSSEPIIPPTEIKNYDDPEYVNRRLKELSDQIDKKYSQKSTEVIEEQ